MEDLFKKFINAGVGFASLTNDRVQKSIDTLVKESKLSEQEGARIMDDLKKNTDSKRKELEKQFQGLTSRLMKSVGVAPNSEVEELKRTVKGSKATPAAAPKKAATTKAAAKPASSATSKAAGTVKKAADATSAAAGKTQKSAAAKAGAAKKETSGSASSEDNA